MADNGVEDLKEFALNVVHQVGEKALRYYGKGDPYKKFDEEVITEAEISLSEQFHTMLNARFPQHQILSRASDYHDYTHEERRYVWVFDPIDGVANFQAGIPVWGTSLALLENLWPLLGVVYLPATGDLFHAQAGGKAFRGNEEIKVSPQEEINDESLLLTFSRFHRYYQTTFPGKIRSFGSTAAHACYVAMGRAEAAVFANDSFQGLAAARVIVEAAGGKIYTLNGREFFLNDYVESQRIDDHLLVVAPGTYEHVRSCVREIGR